MAACRSVVRGPTARGRAAGEGGQALIEFAFVAPIVLVFLLGLVDFGIALDRRVVLDHAVREGARFASVGGQALTTGAAATVEEVKAYTSAQSQGIADAGGAPGSDNYVDVCYEDANANGVVGDVGDSVRVSIHYRHDFVTGFTSMLDASPGSIDMVASGSARVEYRAQGTPASCV